MMKTKEKQKGDVELDVLSVKSFMSRLDGDDCQIRERFHLKNEKFRERDDRKREFYYSEKKRKMDNETEMDESKPTTSDLAEKIKKAAAEASKELMFGSVKLQDSEVQRKKTKVSKQTVLERARKLEELKKEDPEKGKDVAKKEAWKIAMIRAMGIKVRDDPSLIRIGLRKRRQRRQRSAAEWEERARSRDQLKVERQQRRSANIAERINDRRMRKIAKREKKLLRL